MKFSDHIKDREFNKFSVKNGRRVVNTDSPALSSTPYGERFVAQRTTLFEGKANVPSVSQIRNNVIVNPPESSSSVNVSNGEFEINSLPNSEIIFESGERGRYAPGYEAQAGIGFRIPDLELTGESEIEWGYFQGEAGFGFGKDSQGFYVFIKTNGEKEKTRQSFLNVDKLDGNGPSGYSLDLSDGLIFQISYSWYGYGAIKFSAIIKSDDPNIGDYEQIIHRFAPKGAASISQPNLHLTCRIKNDQSEPILAYVGGRQYSIVGKYSPEFRITGEFRGSTTIGTTFSPLITFRRKSESLSQLAQSVKLRASSLAVTDNVIYGYVFDGQLTGANFQNPRRYTASETTLEVDFSATAITGGIGVGPTELAIEGQGNRAQLTRLGGLTFDLIENKNITLVARAVTGTATVNLSTLNMTEEW